MYYHPLINPGFVSQSTDSTPDCFDISSDADPEIVTLSRSAVFENTVFSVFADHIADKNGHQVERYLSVVPKSLLEGAIAGIAVLPVNEGKIGLIQVFRHPLGRWSWEAVKGHVEIGEDIRAAAVRELFEEAGYSIAPERLVDFGYVAPEPGVIMARTHLFVVNVSGAVHHKVDRELGHGKMLFFSHKNINDLIKTGQIEDASTLAILFKEWIAKATPVRP